MHERFGAGAGGVAYGIRAIEGREEGDDAALDAFDGVVDCELFLSTLTTDV